MTFGILISSPSLLEHFQALSRSHKRTIRGGGRGTCSIRTLNCSNSWIFSISVRYVWKGPWWFWLIEKLSVMLHLVAWECLVLTFVDMKHLPFDRFATDGQNPTFTFPRDNDRIYYGDPFALGHLWPQRPNILAQSTSSTIIERILAFEGLSKS